MENKSNNKTILIIVAVIALVVVLAIVFTSGDKKENTNTTTTKQVEGNKNTTQANNKEEENNNSTVNPQSDSEKYNKLVQTRNDYKSVYMNEYNYKEAGAEYYTNQFVIENNNLYAKIDKDNEHTKDITQEKALIKNDIAFVYIAEYGQSEYMAVFASDINGVLYYISNNVNNSKYSMWEPVKVKGVKNVKQVLSYEDNGTVGIRFLDADGNKTTLDDIDFKL